MRYWPKGRSTGKYGVNPLAPTISKNKGSLTKKRPFIFLGLGDDGTKKEVHEIAGTISPGAKLDIPQGCLKGE